MENQLVRTDKLLFKVKRFFRLIFIKNNSQFYQNNVQDISESEIDLNKVISCKTTTQENNIKIGLAEKLIKNEFPIKDLTDEEIDEMIQFFKENIKNKSEELDELKKEIIELKKEK